MNKKQRKIVFALVVTIALMTLTMLIRTNTTAIAKQTTELEVEHNGYQIYTDDYIEEIDDTYEDILIEEQIQEEEDKLINSGLNYRSGTTVEVQKAEKEKKVTNRWNITLSSDEVELLAKIVFLESRGESNIGQRAVTEVILNRMIHDNYNGSLYEVLSSPSQFSSWGARNTANPTDKEYENIKLVLSGHTEILSQEYVYFSTKPRNNKGTVQIGNHYFCKY